MNLTLLHNKTLWHPLKLYNKPKNFNMAYKKTTNLLLHQSPLLWVSSLMQCFTCGVYSKNTTKHMTIKTLYLAVIV